MRGWLLLLFIVVLFRGSVVNAQELEAFYVDDFISPAELRTDEGADRAFLSSRVSTGIDYGYTHENDLTRQTVRFARVANNFYYSGSQINASFTRFLANSDDVRPVYDLDHPELASTRTNMDLVPMYRTAVEFSRYDDDKEEPARFKARWMLDTLMSGAREQEFGGDVEIKIPGNDGFVGGLRYTFRPSRRRHTFGLAYRYTLWQSNRGASMMFGFGWNGQRVDGDWSNGVGRVQTGFILPIVGSTYIYVVGSVAGLAGRAPLTSNPPRRVDYEATAFVTFPILSKLSNPK